MVSNAGTAIGWILFLVALVMPHEGAFNVNILYFGTVIVSVPLLFIFLARAIDGITGGNISVANAYLSDVSSEENRSNNFGKMAISSNLGFILGPALAGVLGGTVYGGTTPSSSSIITIDSNSIRNRILLRESRPKSNPILISLKKGQLERFLHKSVKIATLLIVI